MSAPYEECKCFFCSNDCPNRCEYRDYDECYECINVPEKYKECKDFKDYFQD